MGDTILFWNPPASLSGNQANGFPSFMCTRRQTSPAEATAELRNHLQPSVQDVYDFHQRKGNIPGQIGWSFTNPRSVRVFSIRYSDEILVTLYLMKFVRRFRNLCCGIEARCKSTGNKAVSWSNFV
jgi:hypothetical protein